MVKLWDDFHRVCIFKKNSKMKIHMLIEGEEILNDIKKTTNRLFLYQIILQTLN